MDISKFKDEAAKKHQLFMERLRSQIDKVFADHNLRVETCSSKITLIGNSLKDLGIITDFYAENDGDYRVFTLRKKGLTNCVQVYTNGLNIIVNCDNVKVGNVMGFSLNKKYNIESKLFDWNEFANDLLDKIHYSIYKQSEANEARIDGIFQDPERDDK